MIGNLDRKGIVNGLCMMYIGWWFGGRSASGQHGVDALLAELIPCGDVGPGDSGPPGA